MSSIRALSKHSRSLSRSLQIQQSSQRSFHSPFIALSSNTSPITNPPPPTSNFSSIYEKQLEHLSEPVLSGSGQRTYVVSEPDPAHTPYEVPSGAYPTSAPYQNYTLTEAPSDLPRSSTSASYAHPFTTRAVPQNDSGVNDSAAVRYSEAPGELHQKGGSYGGLGLMDAKTTRKGKGELADRNLAPDNPKVAEKFSAAGVDNAWKQRK
ncbi:unnamed protein product [Somion occarium]|uniref:Uncharacterized protein n=1 Tax=Somion occarium TaxID=3059160 RepID=A0ABP1EAC7_9APHY